MFCMNCGQALAEGARFCANCGTAVNNNSSTQRKTVYDGEIHKCPNCGEILSSFITNCSTCGYEIRNAQAVSSVRMLEKKLEQLEEKKAPEGIGNVLLKAIAGGQINYIDEQKAALIKNFSIPNTKEDVREFVILASSNIDVKLYGMEYHSNQLQGMVMSSQKAVSDAWLSKYEQAYQKAQLLFGGTPEFDNIKMLYEHKMREIQRKKRQMPLLLGGVFGGVALLFGVIFLILALTGAI